MDSRPHPSARGWKLSAHLSQSGILRTSGHCHGLSQMADFSATLRIADVDDFISPAVECVLPIKPQDSQSGLKFETDGPAVQIAVENRFGQIVPRQSTAKITLNDCLACSGCITSAETVLVEAQSVAELLRVVNAGSKTLIVSISPHSRASLAARFGLSTPSAAKRLSTFFKRELGAASVFDSSFAADLALTEARHEFVKRFQAAKASGSPTGNLPVLTSECPGWVCYAEKTQELILPYMSTVRSPQQIMGAFVKRFQSDPDTNVYHVTVMPCADKKLEASRSEFQSDVDLVLTTLEVAGLIEERVEDLGKVVPEDDDASPVITAAEDSGSSGGYLDNVFKHAARELFNVELDGSPLQFKQVGRNADFQETSLVVDGRPVLRFARAYGFRNIQNLVRKIRSGSCPYHYVEVMACPSGCLNGGGQIRGVTLDAVRASYRNGVEIRDPSLGAQRWYEEWVGDGPGSTAARDFAHTSFRAVPKPDALLTKW
ncbi:hypothetical protein PBRA_000641 [Plasmodiophora brassicae]|uniref:Iron hydrogenase large subunit C-terminal domain-containing protein n=1 Tax=Plasmodiophora brassicae TaxID=37360 RepID=A0A0G4IQ67_PLABS|nr:hypothetical protein PBRA_000641 [Plasmodiophora brassicae]